MAAPFRFALQMRNLADPIATAADAAEARALGYEELYSYDHLGAVDPFVPLLTAAAAAPPLHVGPLVLNNELHHPVLLARTAATVDAMTAGRLVLGLGTGYAEDERTTMVTEQLKDLTLDLEVPVLSIVASDKEGIETGKRMRVSHMRGSSALAYEADTVLMLNNKYDVVARHHLVYDTGNVERYKDWANYERLRADNVEAAYRNLLTYR